ncbi:MAG: 4-(cytidine 5'-diphospho)-2-C-methyl-D-erythritol kinase [Brevinema sp.]
MREEFVSTSKINLFLNFIGKDPVDNYHFLESIFWEIPWGDDFVVESADHDEVIFLNAEIESENTVSKALQLFKQKYHITDCFKITITKNTPMGAGIGAGSGDAGALLKFLSKKYEINTLDCLDIAAKVGSDVPFFLYGGAALVEGKGEKITPLESRISENVHGLIVFPNIHSSTPKAFKAIKEKVGKEQHHDKLNFFKKNIVWDIDNLKKMIYNIFNDELYNIDPSLKDVSEMLATRCSPLCMFMTGSGSSFVLLFNNECDLRKAELSLNQVKSYSTHFM